MRKISALGLVLCVLAGVGGCKNLEGPNWLRPGSAEEQQQKAIRYDPFPQTDLGPATSNVRPKSYDKPIAEPSQARWFLNGW
ncbi:MAG: membrane or secreted protein [Pirellulales bacterium]|nr:membrane or secreted protein [Pirellulales bacterium]